MSDAHGVARDQLRSFIERIERLEAEKQTIADDIKDVKGEAKGMGYCVKTINTIIKMRKQDADERAEQEATLDTYLISLGMLPQPDLFDDEPHDAVTGELSPKLAHTIVTGMQTETGRAALVSAVDIMIDREEAEEDNPNSGAFSPPEAAASAFSQGAAKGEVARFDLPENSPETADEMGRDVLRGDDEFSHAVPAENARKAIPEAGLMPQEDGDVTHAGAGEIPATIPEPDGVTFEAFPPAPMKRPAFASCFPEVTGTAYNRLGDDIARNGVQEPIVRMGDVILDGWSRYNIARALGIDYPVIAYRGDDDLLDVIRLQRSARDFTPAQERKIAEQLAKQVPHRAADIFAAFQVEEEFA